MKQLQKVLSGPGAWLLGWLALCAGTVGFVYYWRVFYYLEGRIDALTLNAAALGLVSLAWLAVYGMVHWCKSLEGRAAVCMFLCGVLFCFANPPLQTPDEQNHYLRSYSLSMGWLDFDHDRTYPQDVAKLVESFPGAWVNSHTSQGMTTDDEGNPKAYTSQGYALKQQGESGPVTGITHRALQPILTASSPAVPCRNPTFL